MRPSRFALVFAMAMIIASCAIGPRTEERRMDNLYMFAGSGGAMAYSLDETGANLPQQFAPWRFRREVSTSGATFQAGADKAALEEVRKKGFAVAVFSMKIDGEPIGEDEIPNH